MDLQQYSELMCTARVEVIYPLEYTLCTCTYIRTSTSKAHVHVYMMYTKVCGFQFADKPNIHVARLGSI